MNINTSVHHVATVDMSVHRELSVDDGMTITYTREISIRDKDDNELYIITVFSDDDKPMEFKI